MLCIFTGTRSWVNGSGATFGRTLLFKLPCRGSGVGNFDSSSCELASEWPTGGIGVARVNVRVTARVCLSLALLPLSQLSQCVTCPVVKSTTTWMIPLCFFDCFHDAVFVNCVCNSGTGGIEDKQQGKTGRLLHFRVPGVCSHYRENRTQPTSRR